jgi:hypothetical protein
MKLFLIVMVILALPTFAHEGVRAPDALKEKWGEMKELTAYKYQKVRDSELGQKVKLGAVRAKNSDTAKNIWDRASGYWNRGVEKAKNLLVAVDRKLHEKVLDSK